MKKLLVSFIIPCLICASGEVGFASTTKLFVQTGHSSDVFSVALSPNGQLALSGDRSCMKLWDLASGREIRTFVGINSVSSIAFSADSRKILSVSVKNIKLWDLATGREIRTLSGHTDLVISVAFSPDGRQALSGGYSGNLKFWDLYSGREIRSFSGHSEGVWNIAFSPDGRQALSGSSAMASRNCP